MNSIRSFTAKHKFKIITAGVFVVILVISFIAGRDVNYDGLLDADTLNIYENDALVVSVNPEHMMDTYNGHVGIYLTNTTRLGIGKGHMKELYRLEFLKEGKTISKIKVLTPGTPQAMEKAGQSNLDSEWMKFDDHYIVLYEKQQYFLFGKNFFEHLDSVLPQQVRNAG